jgi:hypothetical protein
MPDDDTYMALASAALAYSPHIASAASADVGSSLMR